MARSSDQESGTHPVPHGSALSSVLCVTLNAQTCGQVLQVGCSETLALEKPLPFGFGTHYVVFLVEYYELKCVSPPKKIMLMS